MISGDQKLLREGSEEHARLQLQRSRVERLDVFVWPHVHSVVEIGRAARAHHYDVITTQDPFWRGLLGLTLSWLTRARLNVQVHADIAGQSVIKRVLARIVLRQADSVRVVSEKLKRQVLHIVPNVTVTLLPLYIDISKFSSIYRRPHSGKNVLWMGRFEREKDPLEAIHVLKEVLKEIPDATLTMIGDGSLRHHLSAAAADLPVHLPSGWQDPLVYLDTADVLLSTSPYESWGAVFVEALAAGVPVVAPDVGIAREAGAIVVPRSKLASAVVKVLQSGEQGVLKLPLPSAEEWARQWRESLI
ncbi:MAG: glycosyltransferase [Patescibacteria group bacterium]